MREFAVNQISKLLALDLAHDDVEQARDTTAFLYRALSVLPEPETWVAVESSRKSGSRVLLLAGERLIAVDAVVGKNVRCNSTFYWLFDRPRVECSWSRRPAKRAPFSYATTWTFRWLSGESLTLRGSVRMSPPAPDEAEQFARTVAERCGALVSSEIPTAV